MPTTYTITDAKNFTDLTLKTGNDTYNINGGVLTIDSDTRFGKNALSTTGSSCPFGNITPSPSLGGNFLVDTRNCRMMSFTGGSGVVPAYDTAVSQSGGTGQLLLVMSAETGGTVHTPGQNMPASGWIKIRKLTGNFVPGAMTGIGCNITIADKQAWIIIVGVEGKSHTHPKLGTCQFRGGAVDIGVTSGVRGQTVQLPFFTSDQIVNYPGVYISLTPAADTWDFWPNAANSFTAANHSTDSRCPNVDISTTGVLTIGLGRDGQPCGHLPPAGCKIRIPSIITQTSTSVTTQFNVNKLPDVNMSSRYKSVFTSAGNLVAEWVTGDWFWSVAQAYTCYMRHIHCADQVVIQEIYTKPDIDEVHQGLSNYSGTYADGYGVLFQQNYFGGDIGYISSLRLKSSSLSGYPTVLVNLYGPWKFRKIRSGNVGPATAISGAIQINTCPDLTIDHAVTTTKRILVMSCKNLKIKRHTYADIPLGTTSTTQATNGIEFVGMCENAVVDLFENWPDAPNTHPLTSLVYCNSAKKIKFRGAGTKDVPYNAGTVNPLKYIFSDGGNNDTIKIQRNWVTALGSSITSGTNSTKNLVAVNNYTTDASKTIGPQQLESYYHGNRCNGGSVPMSYLSVYGTCYWDSFTGDTTTRAALIFVEKTTNTGSVYSTTGNPLFTSQGSMVMAALGDSITYTWAWNILGWTGLTSSTTQGVNTGNHSFEYDLDKGNGFSGVFKTCSAANLSAEVIDPVIGFKLRIRITTITAAATNRMDAFRIDGTTTLAAQNAALYPLDEAELTMSGLVAGSTVAVFDQNALLGTAPLGILTNSGTSGKLVYPFDETKSKCRLEIRKVGYDVVSLLFDNLVEISIPVAQQENKDGFGVSIYGRGPNTTKHLVTLSTADLRIDIGNGRAIAEDVYDVIAEWQATSLGMRYPEVLKFDGTDLLLPTAWRFRRGSLSYSSASIDALPVVSGQPNASPDDETNGSIDFKARSVRTYKLDTQPVYTLNDFAAAVWSFSQANGLTAENNLLGAKSSAETAVAIAASI
jgi:hypothetical protein